MIDEGVDPIFFFVDNMCDDLTKGLYTKGINAQEYFSDQTGADEKMPRAEFYRALEKLGIKRHIDDLYKFYYYADLN